MYKVLRVFILVVVVIAVFDIGYSLYNRFYRLSYVDKQYGFAVMNQRGWYSFQDEEDKLYYQLATRGDNDTALSFFGVEPINNSGRAKGESFKSFIDETCDKNTSDMRIGDYYIDETETSGLNGYLCSVEYYPKNKNTEVFQMEQYYLFNNRGQYDFMIVTGYPKDDTAEKENVERILNSFRAK